MTPRARQVKPPHLQQALRSARHAPKQENSPSAPDCSPMTTPLTHPPIAIAVLAGGESRRMGQDKAALVWQGQTLLERIVQAARQVVPLALVAGRSQPPDWAVPDVPFLPDARPGEGPLRGLESALAFSAPAAVLTIACDMPLLSSAALRWLVAQASFCPPGMDGLAVRNSGQWEPLFSVYFAGCLPRVRERLALGQRSLHRLIETGDFASADAPPWVCAQLVNINTPADLAALPR